MLYQPTTLNCKGKLLDLSSPKVMGILNTTPDSFYDGGQFQNEKSILDQAEKMILEGVDIIDIGGMSSRPGAEIIGTEKELQRVIPAIQSIIKAFPESIISIDTINSKVAKEAVSAGASIINDISAGILDEQMFDTVAALKVPYVLMHMKGKPNNMQKAPVYDDVLTEVLDFLIERVGKLRLLGVKDIVIDPGFGFGKEIEHNFRLIRHLHVFRMMELPILAGISRKSFIYKTLNSSAKGALTGTIALHMVALDEGAKILRVHDVKAAVETIKIWESLQNV